MAWKSILRLLLHSFGKACCLDHTQLVSADGDLLVLVVCLKLKRDQRSIRVDHSRATNDLCSEGRRRGVLDVDNDTDGALTWFKQGQHGAPSAAPAQRHAGDLGNILAEATGQALGVRIDSVLSFEGPTAILGKAVLVEQSDGRLDYGFTHRDLASLTPVEPVAGSHDHGRFH
mgnify:CR=1 FL=1